MYITALTYLSCTYIAPTVCRCSPSDWVCLQTACFPATISQTAPSHSSTHHYWCCICWRALPRVRSIWRLGGRSPGGGGPPHSHYSHLQTVISVACVGRAHSIIQVKLFQFDTCGYTIYVSPNNLFMYASIYDNHSYNSCIDTAYTAEDQELLFALQRQLSIIH